MKQPKGISDLQEAILALHGCKALYSRTMLVRESFHEGVVWDGLVKVFALPNCPKARHCFAWTYREGGKTKTIALLEIPPVDSPETAVKAAIAATSRKG